MPGVGNSASVVGAMPQIDQSFLLKPDAAQSSAGAVAGRVIARGNSGLDVTDPSANATKREKLMGKGYAQQTAGQSASAIATYEEVLTLPSLTAPQAAAAVNEIAWVKRSVGDVKPAWGLAKVAVLLDPKSADSQDTLAVISMEVGDVQGAVVAAQAAVREAPNKGLFHRTLALAYEAAGKDEDAMREMEAATSRDSAIEPDLKDLRTRVERRRK